ncbi:MAG: peroxidase family protein [Hydrogenophaga sp.]|nr:peroxidase family protein [Hydrogenophaga sp.]
MGQTLTVNLGSVVDGDGLTNPVSYIWQAETVAGSGLFRDIAGPNGGAPTALGASFTVTADLEGLALRVKAHYQDGNGVLETVFSDATATVDEGTPPPPPEALINGPQDGIVSPGIHYIGSDLQFILAQIKIAERHAAGEDLLDLVDNPRMAQGLRTVDGSFNNLVQGQTEFGAADNTFPRLLEPDFIDADAGTSYTQTSGTVIDSDPRTISNLIVDQTANNPAAVAAAAGVDGAGLVSGTRADGITEFETFFIPNTAPDEGLSAPFNAWMTFFGQFFDHGLDLVTKGGSGTVFIPLQPDDPLYVVGGSTNFMVLTRATNQPGADGVLGTADDIHEQTNTTSPFVDQNQTYSSHPSHQVFLRAYEFDANGDPQATGDLIVNRDLGPDGTYGTADDVILGGMATWAVVKAQARDILGINLTDADVLNVPLLATDAYGMFIRGPNGFPQVVMPGNVLVEGNPAAPISLVGAVRTGHAFLDDIAHTASPVNGQTGAPLAADADTTAGNPVGAGEYDNELLDAHYIAGDGRVNENIGLTAVHHVFHHEHNRLVEHTKDVVLDTARGGDVSFLNEWLLVQVTEVPVDLSTLVWNGERLFQAAKFGTEMQYQHLVFEEFARTIQPGIDPFLPNVQNYQTEIDPSIVAEFAHTVYRFGHSMLTETIDRLDANYVNSEIGLIDAFLNPLAFAASGPTPEEAAGAIIRGLTRQVGNEIDEFVTEALRNNLLGLPLDLPAINLARGRDTGIPSLNAARTQFYEATGNSVLKPYESWFEFVQHIKHPESLVNFIAAYGTHSTITSATTMEGKRAAASLIVLGGTGAPADRLDFLMSQGAWGTLETGLNLVDFWIGGLAEAKTPFGGMLGSTFNFVFEEQMEKLQNADRFYYLERSAGLNFVTELENNSFAKMVMAATDIAHLPALIFQTNLMLEVDQSRQFNQSVMAGPDGVLGDDPLTLDVDESLDDDPTGSSDPVGDNPLVPLVIRDDPSTLGLDTNYLQYTGGDHVVLGGTDGDDTLIGGIGDDSFWGDAGNDRIEGGDGNDAIRGGAGDDIITDLGGDDNIQGDDGNDVIHAGNGLFNLILGGFGNDFIVNGEDGGEAFGGPGNDFMLGSDGVEQNMGNEGDDWLEGGLLDGSPGDNFDPLGLDMIVGNDVYLGSGLADIMNGEGGDDIMVGSSGPGDKYLGASGFDWATFKDEDFGVSMDLSVRAFDVGPIPVAAGVIARFAEVEGLSGSDQSDYLRGDDADALSIPNAGAQGSVLTNFDLVSGLRDFVGDAGNGADGTAGNADDSFGAGNIILGGDGSDVIEGRGGDDLIDGDMWLNVRISVRANNDGTGAEIASFDSMRPMVPLMLAGTYNPGQLVIVREILEGSGGFNFDTAVFTGNSGDYDISTVGGVTTVAHILDGVAGAGIDGTDRLTGIERLRFADETIVLADGVNAEPEGLLFILDDVTGDFEFEPATGQVLRVSAEDVTDADNPGGVIPGPLTYYWQADFGTGFFQDIMTQTGVGAQLATGTTFTVTPDLAGLSLRVRGVYEDAQGVLEEVRSFPTFAVNALPTGAVLIDDTTPLLGETLTASNTLADANGLGVVSYQWQVSTDGGATWEDILDAIEPSFVVTPAQIGAILRVAASYEDGLGTLETVFSAATEVVSFINTVPTGVVLIDDTTPVLTQVLTASDTLADADGLGTVAYQWQVSNDNGATWDDIVGATGSTYAVTEVGARLRVAASYTDGLGTLETVFSAATGIVAAFNSITGTGAANTLIGTELPDFIQAFGGNDTLIGGAGNDTLQGGVGVDSMVGGTGDDLYLVNVTADVVVELADEGIDTVDSAATYTLSANVENLILRSGFGNINGNGNASGNVLTGNEGANLLSGLDGNDTLIGNAGNDTLNGGTGADSMVGGMGNDLYFVDDAGDQVTELAGGGADEVRTTLAAYTLADQVEILRFTGVGSFAGTGNALNNAIFGGTGNDTLAGGAGNDTMTGGAGNDTYHVDSTGDVITEAAGGGTDTVISSGTAYTLGATLENLVSTNAVGATLTGNGSANQIQGGDGNDNIAAAQGNDTVDGGAGNDTLGGGLGVDLMTGGTGDDLYLVNVTADVVVELADEGIDTVDSAASYTLSANVENLILRSGFGNINGTGNASDNVLTGNAQANQLLGLDGNDTLIGNGGNDTLNGGAGDDSMVGGAGNDIFVFGSGFGHDAITGFDSAPAGGQDRLNISALGINAGNFGASVSISAVGGNTLIGLGADSITLVGVNAATVTQQDFILA